MSDPIHHNWGSMNYEKIGPAANAAAANAAAANAAAAASSYNDQTPAEIIDANALILQKYDSIACPSCRAIAISTNNPNYKCQNCKQKSQGGSKIKSKSQRRKKSKSQRRRKSIKRRH